MQKFSLDAVLVLFGGSFLYSKIFHQHSCADFPRAQVISDFDEMKKLIAKLHVSLEEGEDDQDDQDNEAFKQR